MVKILLVVRDQERKACYEQALDECNAEYTTVRSLPEAIVVASEELHSGILIDMSLMVGISASVKSGVEGLLNGLPSATLNIHFSSGKIRLLWRGAIAQECPDVCRFLAICKDVPARIIFPRKRETFHLNILLDISHDFKTADHTVCIDISSGGCFLFSVRENIAINSSVWILFAGYESDPPLEGVVNWIRPWGTTSDIPGIGIRFVNVSDKIKKFISEIR